MMLNKNIHTILFIGLITTTFVGCDVASDRYRETKALMGTVVHIDICKVDAEKPEVVAAYDEAWGRVRDISERMYVLNEEGDVAKINNANGQAVYVESDTVGLLRSAKKYHTVTNGAFDVTVWPLMDLWKRGEQNNAEPFPAQIAQIKERVNSQLIELKDDNAVKLLNPNTKIDLGGIAKGYAIDEVARIFRKHELSNFYIDAGGDIYVGGSNCKGEPWRVGIRDPQNTARVHAIVEVKNKAVATSGNYEQYFSIKGNQWSHIIDPITGYPQKDVVSATVIAPSAIEADAFATALCVKGAEQGTAMINGYTRDYASLILTKSGKAINESQSTAYARYLPQK